MGPSNISFRSFGVVSTSMIMGEEYTPEISHDYLSNVQNPYEIPLYQLVYKFIVMIYLPMKNSPHQPSSDWSLKYATNNPG